MAEASTAYPFLKGHGTENDFVLLPDHDGTVHGELGPARVRALCDRRAGLGGDGVLRVVRTAAAGRPSSEAEWFMDYRNADGSVSEMCGNGVRVFARHLVEEGLADPTRPLPIDTRDGVKTVTFADPAGPDDPDDPDGAITVDMGVPRVLDDTKVSLGERAWSALHVDMGNPHAVAFLESDDDLAGLSRPGQLLEAPAYDVEVYPHGVNVELVVRVAERHVAMRVHERGSGETRSCGTGACAVLVATALADGGDAGPVHDVDYRVDLPGGTLVLRWTAEGRVLMTGPALVVARGTTSL